MANFCPHSFRMTHLKTLYFCALKLLNLRMRLLIFDHCDGLVEHLSNDSIFTYRIPYAEKKVQTIFLSVPSSTQ